MRQGYWVKLTNSSSGGITLFQTSYKEDSTIEVEFFFFFWGWISKVDYKVCVSEWCWDKNEWCLIKSREKEVDKNMCDFFIQTKENNDFLETLSGQMVLPTKPLVKNIQTICFRIMLLILSLDVFKVSNTSSILKILFSKWHQFIFYS